MYINKKMQLFVENEIKEAFGFLSIQFDKIEKSLARMERKISAAALDKKIDQRLAKRNETDLLCKQLRSLESVVKELVEVNKPYSGDKVSIPPLSYTTVEWLGMAAEVGTPPEKEVSECYNVAGLSLIPEDSEHTWRWSEMRNNVNHVFCEACKFVPNESSTRKQMMECNHNG